MLKEYLRLVRPAQWIKSGFVLMGILFGNAWRLPDMRFKALVAAAAFSLIASGVYVMNDLADRKNDLEHPLKRLRPLASGAVSTGGALALMVSLWIAGLVLGGLASSKVVWILLAYVAVNVAYSGGVKHIAILDVFVIALGFMLRILAGTTGIGITPSQWILLCGLMVALFLGFAKRRAELYAVTPENSAHRKVLVHYSAVFLDKMIVVTAACVIMSYALYTMSPTTIQAHRTESLIYTLPFVIYGVARYIFSLHKFSTGSDPAQEIVRDPHILFSIVGWLVTTVLILG